MALGIFISMKIFRIPDITTDGSYTLGAVISAVLLTAHWNSIAIIPIVLLSGAVAGTMTGLIHAKLKIEALLSGILVMTGLYSINLTILGRSNVPLLNVRTIFSGLQTVLPSVYGDLIISVGIIALVALMVGYILSTDFGVAMRATGNSESMTRAMGINNDRMKIIGLAMANALTALSGYLVAQYQNFTDINMGIGIVITGLGSVLIGETLIKWWNIRSIAISLLVVITGSVLFQLVLAFTLSLGVDPNLLKLVTAIFVLVIVIIPRLKKKV
jgi:putative tryptophan/tyrosine transport system permease protein